MEATLRFQEEQVYWRQRDFALTLAAFLGQYPQYGKFLALLEAGSALNGATSDLLAALEDYPPQQYSALLAESVLAEEVAPYLVNLENPSWRGADASLTDFADWLFSRRDFACLGVFFVSSAPFIQIKNFWQKFSHARFHDKRDAYFRFYNPRFFDMLLKNLGRKDYKSISSITEVIFYFDYFNPDCVHIYRFYPHVFKQEDYDLTRADNAALIRSLFSAPPA